MSYPITSFSKGDAANIVLIISIVTFIIYIIIQTNAVVNDMTVLVQLERNLSKSWYNFMNQTTEDW